MKKGYLVESQLQEDRRLSRRDRVRVWRFALAVAVLAAALLAYGLTNTLTLVGGMACVCGFGMGCCVLALLILEDKAKPWFRFGMVPALGAALVVAFVVQVGGPYTEDLPEGAVSAEAFVAELHTAKSRYTGHVEIMPAQPGGALAATSCLATGELPEGVTYTSAAGQCLVTVDWEKNHVVAWPKLNGKNALDQLGWDIKRSSGPTELVFRFPVSVAVKFFVYNRDHASEARPLPAEYDVTKGCEACAIAEAVVPTTS